MTSTFWQTCPLCRGQGSILITPVGDTTTLHPAQCHICLGWGIISTTTGKPPQGKKEN